MCLYSIVYSTSCLFQCHLSSLAGYVLFGKIQISPATPGGNVWAGEGVAFHNWVICTDDVCLAGSCVV